jgi:hypothetical protein
MATVRRWRRVPGRSQRQGEYVVEVRLVWQLELSEVGSDRVVDRAASSWRPIMKLRVGGFKVRRCQFTEFLGEVLSETEVVGDVPQQWDRATATVAFRKCGPAGPGTEEHNVGPLHECCGGFLLDRHLKRARLRHHAHILPSNVRSWQRS